MWYYQLLLKQLKIVQQSSRVIDGTLVFQIQRPIG